MYSFSSTLCSRYLVHWVRVVTTYNINAYAANRKPLLCKNDNVLRVTVKQFQLNWYIWYFTNKQINTIYTYRGLRIYQLQYTSAVKTILFQLIIHVWSIWIRHTLLQATRRFMRILLFYREIIKTCLDSQLLQCFKLATDSSQFISWAEVFCIKG